jgi:transposase-like protein
MGIRERNGRIRAFPISGTSQVDFHSAIVENVRRGSNVYTDCHRSYDCMKGYVHDVVKHSVGEYVNGKAHTNGIESFWALLKRGYYGTFHHMSVKHLHRYVNEFSLRHDMGHDIMPTINSITDGMIGRRLTYERLKA